MHRNKRTWRVGLLCLASIAALPFGVMAQQAGPVEATAPAAGGQALLNAIPNDATGFVAIRNLSELDKDVQAISTMIGFPLGPEGMFPAPLAWLKSSMQMTQGLQDNGGAALVLLNARDIKSIEEIPDRLIIYLPASDPKALLTSMGGEEGTDGLYKVDLGGAPSVAAVREGFVLIAKAPQPGAADASQTLVAAAKAKGDGVIKAMAADRVKAYASQDVFVWINFRTLSDDVRKQITDGLRDLFANLGGAAASQPAGDGDEAVQQVEKFLTQGDEVSVGLQLDAKIGLNISAYSRVKPDTELANMIAATKPPKEDLLAGLPEENFILAMGAVVGTTPQYLEQMRKTTEGLIKRVAAMDQDPGSPLTEENLRPLVDVWLDLLQRTQRLAGSISSLGDAQGQGSALGLTVVAKVQDAKAWRGEVRKSFERVKEIAAGVMKADGVEQAKIDEVMNAIVWQENAAQVAGASVDVLRVDLDKVTTVPPETVQQIKAVTGPEGLLVRVAAVGDNTVVIAFGGGEERLAKIIAVAEKNESPLANNPQIRKVSGRLPTKARVAEGYVALDHLLDAIDVIGTRLQSPLPVRLTLTDSAPLAFSTVNVDDLAQQVNLLIPVELIVSGSEMVRMQLLPMMLGGMGGGGMGMEEPTEGEGQDGGAEETPQQ